MAPPEAPLNRRSDRSPGRIAQARSWLPQGGDRLPPAVWHLRHRCVVGLLAVQTAAVPLFALLMGFPIDHALLEAAAPAVMTGLASWDRLPRVLRAGLAGLGLVVVSAIVVHLSGGAIEAHFHFFAMVPIVALYESWFPFGLAVSFVLVHHGIIGTIQSEAVYNHDSARENPWTWAAIHAALFGSACIGALINWKLHESARGVAMDLSHKVHHDALTGLPNRTLLHNRTMRALDSAGRRDEQPTMLLLDLDGFKDVNDMLGHVNGDLLLVEVANRLRSTVRPNDSVVSRLGGDEFAVLLTECPTSTGEQVAARITTALSVPFTIDGVSVDLEVSIGIATADPGDDALTLVRHADVAMYSAKENKLGCTRYRAGQEATAATRLELLGGLRRALDGDEVLLHYQPKIAITTGQVVGVEALARWQHPSRGLLMPELFIPVLEKTTLCHRFAAQVLAMALVQARQWADEGLRLPVAVNVSTRCLLDPRFAETVADELSAAGVAGELLCIEITENTVMVDPDVAIATLSQVRELGVRTAVDDFGTGYSSMAYLNALPVDELKIDRCFVRDLAINPGNAALVDAAVGLGHNLGIVVVAEGVEDAGAAARLLELGCDLGQGYYYSAALPAAELSKDHPAWWVARRDTTPSATVSPLSSARSSPA